MLVNSSRGVGHTMATAIAVDVDVNCMTCGKGPKGFVNNLWPAGLGMKEHSQSPCGYNTDAAFNNAIHVVSTCSGHCVVLTLLREIFSELAIHKYTIV